MTWNDLEIARKEADPEVEIARLHAVYQRRELELYRLLAAYVATRSSEGISKHGEENVMASGDEQSGFEGFAVIELFGHRRLAGYLRPVELAGAGFLRLDIPGDKTDDPPKATQLYSPAAVYGITPTSEEIVRAVARRMDNIGPVQRWELPAPKPRVEQGDVVGLLRDIAEATGTTEKALPAVLHERLEDTIALLGVPTEQERSWEPDPDDTGDDLERSNEDE